MDTPEGLDMDTPEGLDMDTPEGLDMDTPEGWIWIRQKAGDGYLARSSLQTVPNEGLDSINP
jgi:hypothetical protein